MSDAPYRKLFSAVLVMLLHLPLLGYVLWLYPRLESGQNILHLPASELLLLLALLLLPYGMLNRLVPGWNPARARLGEYED